MSRLALLVFVLLAGCFGPGPVRRRPGGNITLPAHVGLVDGLLQGAACAIRQRQDSANLSRPRTPQARDSVLGACGVSPTGPKRSGG